MSPTVLVLMGASGSGKTTVGAQLARRLGWAFMEGDDLHSVANIEKMRKGLPLTDADRAPWLDAVAAWIDAWIDAGLHGVITCSALKRFYRRRLVDGRPGVVFIFLKASQTVLAGRLASRTGHFMPPSLLASQLATLEALGPDEPGFAIDADAPAAAQVDAVIAALAQCPDRCSSRGRP